MRGDAHCSWRGCVGDMAKLRERRKERKIERRWSRDVEERRTHGTARKEWEEEEERKRMKY